MHVQVAAGHTISSYPKNVVPNYSVGRGRGREVKRQMAAARKESYRFVSAA